MICVNKALPPGTFAVYNGNKIVEIVCARDWFAADRWAQRKHPGSYVCETVSAVEVAYE